MHLIYCKVSNLIAKIFFFFRYILLRLPESIDLVPDGQNFALFNADTGDNIAPDITINQTFEVGKVSDNYFSSFWQSIVAVYFWTNGRWDQVDQWNFFPVQALCFCT